MSASADHPQHELLERARSIGLDGKAAVNFGKVDHARWSFLSTESASGSPETFS